MEENENNGECENGNVAVDAAPAHVLTNGTNHVLTNGTNHVLTNGTNHLHQIENTLAVAKLRPNNEMEKETNGAIKPYANGNNGVHEENGKPYANGFAKKILNGGSEVTNGVKAANGVKATYLNGSHPKVPDENCPGANFVVTRGGDMIGDTIDTLKQYTTQIDRTLESLEQCQNELSHQLSNHKARTTNENHNHSEKNENNNTTNTNGTKNENHTKNENTKSCESNGSVENGCVNGVESSAQEYLPMLNIDDDEEEVFPTVPDATEDEDMLIQEKIMQSKSELISKLNSQEQVTNLITEDPAEVTNGDCSTTTSHVPECSETSSSSSCSSSSTQEPGTEAKELTLFESCRQGRYEKVKEILTRTGNVDINMTDGDSWSCLHEVSIRTCQFTPIVELLLQNGADPNLRDKKGETPLHGAVLFHLVDTIKLLLQYNADCNICNNTNVSPLKLATYLKDNEILTLFGQPASEDKSSSSGTVKKKKKKRKRHSDKNFTLPLSTSPSILKKPRRASDEPCSSSTRSKKRINFSL